MMGHITLPTELVYKIIALLHRNQLPSVALVSHIFKDEAERLLYLNVGPHLSLAAWFSCLDTLTAVQSKAVLVKSFDLIVQESKASPILVKRLCSSLLQLTSLRHLRLCFYDRYPLPHVDDIDLPLLNDTLAHCTFSLASLYIPRYLNLATWIPNQKDLNCIGMESRSRETRAPQLEYLKYLVTSLPPENHLVIFWIAPLHRGDFLDSITVFPFFSKQWSAEPIRDALPSIVRPYDIKSFVVQLETLSDNALIRNVVSSICQYFPTTSSLTLRVRDPQIHLRPEKLSPILALLPQLWEFKVRYWDGVVSSHPYRECGIDLAKIWLAQCPELIEVGFPDFSKCSFYMDEGWR